jgi:hypothetical protein
MTPEEEQKYTTLQVLCTYLLYERKQETQLSGSFAMLAQERHNQFHTEGDHMNGDGSSFGDCDNQVCRDAMKILKDSRSAGIEVNAFTLQLVEGFSLKVAIAGQTCRVWLEQKGKVALT